MEINIKININLSWEEFFLVIMWTNMAIKLGRNNKIRDFVNTHLCEIWEYWV